MVRAARTSRENEFSSSMSVESRKSGIPEICGNPLSSVKTPLSTCGNPFPQRTLTKDWGYHILCHGPEDCPRTTTTRKGSFPAWGNAVEPVFQARFRMSLIRACQPLPLNRKRSTTSRSRRSVTETLVGAFCGPRVRRIFSAARGAPRQRAWHRPAFRPSPWRYPRPPVNGLAVAAFGLGGRIIEGVLCSVGRFVFDNYLGYMPQFGVSSRNLIRVLVFLPKLERRRSV